MSLKSNTCTTILLSPKNLDNVNEEQVERFHQDIEEKEKLYQGRWNLNKMGENCWSPHREQQNVSH